LLFGRRGDAAPELFAGCLVCHPPLVKETRAEARCWCGIPGRQSVVLCFEIFVVGIVDALRIILLLSR
jgi:hypothetical protein